MSVRAPNERRRGPLRRVMATLPDGQLVLECTHRVPATRHYETARCCFCAEAPRAAYFRKHGRAA